MFRSLTHMYRLETGGLQFNEMAKSPPAQVKVYMLHVEIQMCLYICYQSYSPLVYSPAEPWVTPQGEYLT